MKEVTYSEALREALREEMRRDETVFIFGEDVRGAMWCTSRLVEEFGNDRVRDTPISEGAIVGCAIGAARTGLRPVAEIMFDDLLPLAAEQIINQAARMRYMFGETNTSLPVVIRSVGGSGPGLAGHHSSSLADWFMHIPGLKVAVPSTPYDAKGLLKTAIRGNDPVLFFEHKQLYATRGPVPEEEYTIPLGKADIKREGKDVTIAATSWMVLKALGAAEKLAKDGVSAEVVDPRTLVPLDKKSILDSVKKTGRFVVVHESWKTCGMGSELAAIVAEEALDSLDAPIKRVAAKTAPIPLSPPLEQYVLPSEDDIVKAVREVVA
jgi:pyruvate/2-oxoglutarate/acetoin dehydrogenase E1 component